MVRTGLPGAGGGRWFPGRPCSGRTVAGSRQLCSRSLGPGQAAGRIQFERLHRCTVEPVKGLRAPTGTAPGPESGPGQHRPRAVSWQAAHPGPQPEPAKSRGG